MQREHVCLGTLRGAQPGRARTGQWERSLERGQQLVTKGSVQGEMGQTGEKDRVARRGVQFGDGVEMSVGDRIDGLESMRESQHGDSLETISLWMVIEATEAEGMALY